MRILRTIFIALFSTLVFGLLTVYDGFQLSAQSNQNNSETQSTQEIPEVIYDPELLPEKVAKTRKSILEAARTGDLESLRPVLEDSELKPVISFENVDDPIAYWRSWCPAPHRALPDAGHHWHFPRRAVAFPDTTSPRS